MTEIFKAFLLTSAIGTISAILLFLIRPITKKVFSAGWHYYIWLTILIVMIFPIKLTSTKLQDTPPSIRTVNTDMTYETSIDNIPVTEYDPTSQSPELITEQTIEALTDFSELFSYIWIAGVILLLLIRLISYIIFIINIHRHTYIVSCPEIGNYTKRKIETRVSKRLSSPLITGIFRPKLLLPQITLTENQLHNILSHETTHLKRNDLLYKWFVSLVKCICWHNPFIYLISRQIDIDCEISCDFAVTKNMNEDEKKSYIETILSLLTHNKSRVVPLTTGMANNKKILKRRFAMIKKNFKFSKKTMIISVISAIVILGIAVFTSGILNGKLFNTYQNTVITLNTDDRKGDNFNTLLIGVDSQGRADTIIAAIITDNNLTGLFIPRDTFFDDKKISDILAEENGDQKVVDTIRHKLSIPITYYAKIKIDLIKDLINDGLYIDIPMDMEYDDPYQNLHISLKKGQNQYLDGDSISKLLRYRKSNDGFGYPDGDLGRIKTGQQITAEYLKNLKSGDIIGNSKKIIDSINNNVVTNYPLKNYVKDKNILANKSISLYTIPGTTTTRNGAYIYEIDYGRLNNLLSYDIAVSKGISANNKTPQSTIEDFFMYFEKGDFESMKSYCTKDFVAKKFYGNEVAGMKTAKLTKIVTDLSEDLLKENPIIDVAATIPSEKPEKQGAFVETSLRLSLIKQPNGQYLINDFVL